MAKFAAAVAKSKIYFCRDFLIKCPQHKLSEILQIVVSNPCTPVIEFLSRANILAHEMILQNSKNYMILRELSGYREVQPEFLKIFKEIHGISFKQLDLKNLIGLKRLSFEVNGGNVNLS